MPPRPSAASAAPWKSIRVSSAARADRPGTARAAVSSATATSGTFSRKIQRHDAVSMICPPTSGPTSTPMPPNAVHEPIAAPRSSLGKTATMMASAAGVSIAPATPWRARAAISTSTVGASAQSTEAAPNQVTPVTKMRRSPRRSVSDPASRISALSVSR